MAGKRLQEKLDRLKAAGFSICWADPKEAHEKGYVRYDHREVATCYGAEGMVPFVDFGVRGEDTYDQVPTWERSNFRSLVRDFPGVFTPVSWTNVDSLAGFPHSMPDDLIDTLIGLREQYPIYDEGDVSDLESDEVFESWDQYLWRDTYSGLPEEWQEVADLFDESWLRGTHEIRDAFFAATQEGDYYPEHDGMAVRWDDGEVQGLVITALCNLVREHYAPGEQVECLL